MAPSSSDEDTNSQYDTVSDCDADMDIEDLYQAVTNIIGHVLNGDSLGPQYHALIDGYHERHDCVCGNLLSTDAAVFTS